MCKGNFIQNLPKIYGTYTGGFIVFIILMALADQAGVSAKNIGVMFVAFTVLIYALIGYLSRTIQVDAYYVCLLYTSPSPRDGLLSRMPSSA